jgi:hypothetical protein
VVESANYTLEGFAELVGPLACAAPPDVTLPLLASLAQLALAIGLLGTGRHAIRRRAQAEDAA